MSDVGYGSVLAGDPSEQIRLPNIHLLCRFESASKAFKHAVTEHFPELSDLAEIKIHSCSLTALPADVKFDAIVSPANSHGFMDGAFDDAISVLLSPNRTQGYSWTTKKVQATLYQKWRGYAPPGSCTVIDARRDAAWHGIKSNEQAIDSSKPSIMRALLPSSQHVPDTSSEHKHGCKYIALCPTMRVPRDVRWDREVVFECIWSLLCALQTHNAQAQDPEQQIRTILMTPLATGVGKISDAKWAAQCVFAIKAWVDAVRNPQKWSNPKWKDTHEGAWGGLETTQIL